MKIFYSKLLGISFALLLSHQIVLAETASILPDGRWRVRLITAYTQASNEYNDVGNSQALGQPFSIPLPARLLAGLNAENKAKMQQLQSLLPQINDSFSFATLHTDIEASVLANYLVLEHGVTDHLSLGLILPILNGSVKVKANSETTPEFESLTQQSPEPLKAELMKIKASTSTTSLHQMLTNQLQYRDGLNSWSGTGIGDLELGAKYNYFRSMNWRMSTKGGLRLPTGRQ